MRIKYEEIDAGALDLVERLWEKLRKYQEVRSAHFAQHYAGRTWVGRRIELLEKARTS
jgi:pyruvate-formate lyase